MKATGGSGKERPERRRWRGAATAASGAVAATVLAVSLLHITGGTAQARPTQVAAGASSNDAANSTAGAKSGVKPSPKPSGTPSGKSSATASSAPSGAIASPSPSGQPTAGGGTTGAGMQAVEQAVKAAHGTASVAAVDLDSGATVSYGGSGHAFVTASIAKVDILATLLLQAQDRGAGLTSDQQALATRMIQNSDNDAASALYGEIGEAAGLDAANKRFGMTSTSGGSGLYWGLTTTTAQDQLTLLRQVFTSSSKLTAASRSYLTGLMQQVEADQRWGVSAAATGGTTALKNGWLPRSATNLWVINSVGRVQRDGHTLLIAVVSDGNADESTGISLVQSIAKAAGADLH